MRHRSLLISFVVLLSLAVPGIAGAANAPRAVVFSKSTTLEGVAEGGLYAVRAGHLNQLTGNPADTEPAFSPDGRTIAFVRDGDLYSVRPDGSGQRHLTSGPELDSAPVVSPNGRFVVFERRSAADGPADLYTVRVLGGGLHALTSGPEDDQQARLLARRPHDRLRPRQHRRRRHERGHLLDPPLRPRLHPPHAHGRRRRVRAALLRRRHRLQPR